MQCQSRQGAVDRRSNAAVKKAEFVCKSELCSYCNSGNLYFRGAYAAFLEVTMTAAKQEILIVDDDASVCLSMFYLLTEDGATVRMAENGLEALACIREQVPHVLLSDLKMPGMSGFELLAVVRCRFPQIHVIAMSGAFSGIGIPPGVTADAFYEKGSNPRLLLKIVESMRQANSPLASDNVQPLASVWIPRNGQTFPGEETAVISCPECLRAFSLAIGTPTSALQETVCVYCRGKIRYISEPTVLPGALHTFPRIPGPALPSLLSIPDFG